MNFRTGLNLKKVVVLTNLNIRSASGLGMSVNICGTLKIQNTLIAF